MQQKLSLCQKKALPHLEEKKNIFLTGAAGSGKSFLLQHFRKDKNKAEFPILASTGMAAILIDGITFHSFFGLGIMEKGLEESVERAVKNARVRRRIRKAKQIIIDEISMLPGEALAAGEAIAKKVKESNAPWGGLRIIAVGDFAQLPPVSSKTKEKPWAFLHPVWEETEFHPLILRTIMRSLDKDFLFILNQIRQGNCSLEVKKYLNERASAYEESAHTTHLFARRKCTLEYNSKRLAQLSAPSQTYEMTCEGEERAIQVLKKQSPLEEKLKVKEGAMVVIRKNDPRQRWSNGSIGHYLGVREECMEIKLLSGKKIEIEKASYYWLSPEGKTLAHVRNYPVNLAWASTIHRAQGASFDKLSVDIQNLWEEGHAYVALSRVRQGDSLFVKRWTENSIRKSCSPTVQRFHEEIGML